MIENTEYKVNDDDNHTYIITQFSASLSLLIWLKLIKIPAVAIKDLGSLVDSDSISNIESFEDVKNSAKKNNELNDIFAILQTILVEMEPEHIMKLGKDLMSCVSVAADDALVKTQNLKKDFDKHFNAVGVVYVMPLLMEIIRFNYGPLVKGILKKIPGMAEIKTETE